ncbi:MAG: YkgJ family cysteine cluster protein [Promethearchaeia archaeon]
MHSKNLKAPEGFVCAQCGRCCRSGYEILIHPEDAKRWIQARRIDLIRQIQIDPKCISTNYQGNLHERKANLLSRLKSRFSPHELVKHLSHLIDFITHHHTYGGRDPRNVSIQTFIPGLTHMPVLIPKNFQVMREGWRRGLVYILKQEEGGKCPFLKHNLCSIHPIKPSDCKTFPYDIRGNLRKDIYTLSLCEGLKERKG